jgi:hypothetical protein
LIAAARNKKAGLMIAAGVFLFLLAIGINTIYSMHTDCLDVLPPQCFTGYDNLSESQKVIVSPGLYVIAVSAVIAGSVLWFRQAQVLQVPRA